MNISIYKTSVTKKSHVAILTPFLNQLGKWNFDLEDCDKVLRIESSSNITSAVINLLTNNGFVCDELQ